MCDWKPGVATTCVNEPYRVKRKNTWGKNKQGIQLIVTGRYWLVTLIAVKIVDLEVVDPTFETGMTTLNVAASHWYPKLLTHREQEY